MLSEPWSDRFQLYYAYLFLNSLNNRFCRTFKFKLWVGGGRVHCAGTRPYCAWLGGFIVNYFSKCSVRVIDDNWNVF